MSFVDNLTWREFYLVFVAKDVAEASSRGEYNVSIAFFHDSAEGVDIWMTYTLNKAFEIAHQKGYQTPPFIKKYVDDILAKFRLRPLEGEKAIENFLNCLNAVHPRVQFTVEHEEDDQIPFLDCLIRRLPNGKVTTTVYRKASDTNLVINPLSCQHPNNITGTFKGFLCRAHRLCATPELLKEEINNLLDIWEDNGHSRERLKKIADTYSPPCSPDETPEPHFNLSLKSTSASISTSTHYGYDIKATQFCL